MTQTKAEMKSEKADKKATKATEEMHRVVTSSLEEIQHPGAAAKNLTHEVKTGAGKAPHKAESHKKKM